MEDGGKGNFTSLSTFNPNVIIISLMSQQDTHTASKPKNLLALPWADFLTICPPGQQRQVNNLAERALETTWTLAMPVLKLYCPTEACERECFFDHEGYQSSPKYDGWEPRFLLYKCRHCKRTTKLFAVIVRLEAVNKDKLVGIAAKLGEWPPFGPHIPTKLNVLLGPDRDYFFNGCRAESQGMGIGAFVYYRRVVENQKTKIIEEILKVCRRIGASERVIRELEFAQREIHFSSAVKKVKRAIPDVLKINWHNPLVLLHSALSQGLHAKSDEECLEIATSIRVLLTDLAERLGQALKEQAELQSAVSRLLQTKAGPSSAPVTSTTGLGKPSC